MKTLLIAFCFAFSLTVSAQFIARPGAPLGANILNTSLNGYWKLDEASSSTRADSDPTTPQDLTDTGGVTQTTGVVGNAALFASASSQKLSHVDSAKLSVGDIDFSFTCWVRFTTTNSAQNIASQWNTTGNQRAWKIVWLAASSVFQFVISPDGTSSGNTTLSSSFSGVTTNVYYFVFVAHDSVNNLVKISINDGTVNTASVSTGVFDSTSDFCLGALASGSNYFDGALDEFIFWKKVLTAQEISALYAAQTTGLTCCPFQ